MAVTLEWIRDTYDTIIKDRYIDDDEVLLCVNDYFSGKATGEQLAAVRSANENQTLLPAYDTPPTNGEVTLVWIRDNYDTIVKDRHIDDGEAAIAVNDFFAGGITKEQMDAVIAANEAQTLLPAYPSPPINGGIDPIMETPDVRSLEAGKYNIIVTKRDYNTVYAKITVDSGGNVSCDSVTGGACGGTGYPRVVASGTSVKVYMAAKTPSVGYDAWLAGKGGLSGIALPDIFELKDEFIGLTTTLGFTPTLPQIMECKDAFIGLI